uniref:Pentacotripeptide-repeat region of PRORP domain-containing protein n=1 Tax=Lactuca sativa TaxID=4236 RepID=A0A9R1V8B8_LACSA|nr:hypothetical protein LSAT_V11C600326860 [Lactuca sativa]
MVLKKSFIPNSLTYKVVVNTLWKEGRIDEAFAAIEDMERCGIVGSVAVYYDLARCLCSAGGCNEALIQLGLVIDLTNTSRYYSMNDWKKEGIKYVMEVEVIYGSDLDTSVYGSGFPRASDERPSPLVCIA